MASVAEDLQANSTRSSWNLFNNNVATVQMLGLCPLLAVSNSLSNAAGLAVASAFVLIGSATIVSVIRKFIPENVRLPIFVLVIATFTTVAVMLMEAFAWSIYVQIALFMQIIVTNCMILGRINLIASKNPIGESMLDAIKTGMEFGFVLLLLGGIRELLTPIFTLAQHPAGAFLIFGLLIAAFNVVSNINQDNRRIQVKATT